MVSATLTTAIKAADENDDADRLVPLTKVKFPGNPHSVTRWRWRNRGVNRGGRRVRLKTVICGVRVYCCQRWADEFVAACNLDIPTAETPHDYSRRAKSENDALKAVLSQARTSTRSSLRRGSRPS